MKKDLPFLSTYLDCVYNWGDTEISWLAPNEGARPNLLLRRLWMAGLLEGEAKKSRLAQNFAINKKNPQFWSNPADILAT